MDTGSIPGRWFGRIGFLAAAVLTASGWQMSALDLRTEFGGASDFLLISSLIGMISLLLQGLKHRGPIHKYWLPVFLLFMAVYGSFSGIFIPSVLCAFGCGICAHLTLDGIFPWDFKGWIF